jgi:hypothetical protein
MYIVGLVSENIYAKARSLVLSWYMWRNFYGSFYLKIACYVGTWGFDVSSVLDFYPRWCDDARPEDVIHFV